MSLETLNSAINDTMLRDRRRLRQWWEAISRDVRAGKLRDVQIGKLSEAVRVSAEEVARRRHELPRPAYPEHLPVVEKREAIAKAIAENQVIVLCGETGSGKTTQLPKICLDLGRGVTGLIGHTQPRRLAARSVAARIAQELKSPLGQYVGYKVRFNEQTSPRTFVKLMTDGILLAETQGDRLLEQYDTLIIDEAHERSLNIDFLLGYLRQLLPKRPEFKLIITSATIDPDRFSKHFGGAPVIEVSGRTYPVETRYRPIVVEEDEDEEDPNVLQAITQAVDELAREKPGDVLVFLSGEREIRETAEALRKGSHGGAEILPLYARLSADEQNKIFQPHGRRRIVLATNVAETSLTVPGIRYVIDPGYARISRYSARTRVQRLPIEKVSQASANQRKGRCGRVAEGVCIRLYAEEDFASRPLYTEPEIQRTNLASVILQMKALNLGRVEEFPFIDPPDGRMIRDGYQTLHELGAVTEEGELTPLGRDLAKLPVDPRIGRMILAAALEGALKEVLVIAAALSVQDPRERPIDAQTAADERHGKFRDPNSDFLSFLLLWEWFHRESRGISSKAMWRKCRENFVSYLRMREWMDVHRQLEELAGEMKLQINRTAATADQIHRALLTGLLGNVGYKSEGYEYVGARGRKFNIHPGSTLFKAQPAWLMAAEIVETTRVYARTVAPVRPSWLEKIGAHLVQYSHTELRWNKDTARVEADERVSLFGMVIVPKRVVHFGPINPEASREIFLRYAMVEGDYRQTAPYAKNNAALVQKVRLMEAKTRRHDLLVDAQTRFGFYNQRVPANVNSGQRFERWRREAERENPKALFMGFGDVLRPGAEPVSDADFPDTFRLGETALPLTYRYDPGEVSDGITLTVPLAILSQLRPERFEWLVPGMLLEKVTSLIKSLPTALRRSFVPVPDFARAATAALSAGDESLLEALARQLGKFSGMEVAPSDFRLDTLPEYLFMNFRVVDENGRQLAAGRDLGALQMKLAPQVTGAFTRIEHPDYNRDGLLDWEFPDLPERVQVRRHGMQLWGYPAIVDQTTAVGLRLMDSPDTARHAMHDGLIRLFQLRLPADFRYLGHDFFPDLNAMAMHYAMVGTAQEMKSDLLALMADRTFLADGGDVRTKAEFERRREDGRQRLFEVAEGVKKVVQEILSVYHEITLDLERPYPADFTPSICDIQEQLQHLMRRHFMRLTPWEWLVHFPRYLRAVQVRMQKLRAGHLSRDLRHMDDLENAWQTYLTRHDRHKEQNIFDPELTRYRWMIEELRVSLFAQELSTAIPISAKRLEKQLALVR